MKNITYQDIQNALYNEGYRLYKDGLYRTNFYVAKIKWEESVKTWSIVISPDLEE